MHKFRGQVSESGSFGFRHAIRRRRLTRVNRAGRMKFARMRIERGFVRVERMARDIIILRRGAAEFMSRVSSRVISVPDNPTRYVPERTTTPFEAQFLSTGIPSAMSLD